MTTESAMDELLNVGHDFFAFRSIETGGIPQLRKKKRADIWKIAAFTSRSVPGVCGTEELLLLGK